jgi:hypothetical protein
VGFVIVVDKIVHNQSLEELLAVELNQRRHSVRIIYPGQPLTQSRALRTFAPLAALADAL